jgi:hypothetical protein
MQYTIRRVTAAMCLGCLLFARHTVARCEERDDYGFVPLFNRHEK